MTDFRDKLRSFLLGHLIGWWIIAIPVYIFLFSESYQYIFHLSATLVYLYIRIYMMIENEKP